MSKRPQSTGSLPLQTDASLEAQKQNVSMMPDRGEEAAVSPAGVRPPTTASTPGTGGPAPKRVEVAQNPAEQEGAVNAQTAVQQLVHQPYDYGYVPPNPGFPSASYPFPPGWRPEHGFPQPYQARFTNPKLHSSCTPAPWQYQHFFFALCLPF